MAISITFITTFLFVVIWSVYAVSQSGIALSSERMGADVLILPNEAKVNDVEFIYTGISQMVYMDKHIIDGKLPGEEIEAITPQFFLETLPAAGCCSTDRQLRVVGIDFDSDFLLKPWFKQEHIDKLSDKDLVSGYKAIPTDGKKTFILNNLFQISGFLYPTGTGMDDSVFIDIDKVRVLAKKNFSQRYFNHQNVENLVTAYLIKVKESVDPEAFYKKLQQSNLNAQVVSVSRTRTALRKQLAQFSHLLFLLWIFMALTCGISLVAQFNGLIADRKREIGYLRSIGVKRNEVFLMVLYEVGIQGGIGGAIGSVLGVLSVSPALVMLHGIITIPEGEWTLGIAALHAGGGIVLSLLICLAACVIPAMRIAKLEPHEAMSQGEL